MEMDDGEVLQGLADKWTFMGATLMEWGAGAVMFFIISLFGRSPVSIMPLMLAGMIITTYMLASLRKMFPDEERGVRNVFMTSCGFPPPDIPAPALLQPVWSPAPVRELPEDCNYRYLGLDVLFSSLDEKMIIEEFE
ncbi:MAG: hypothetical protein PHC51_11060 [bacterium]|nr:hypothetical protein [bacterium]